VELRGAWLVWTALLLAGVPAALPAQPWYTVEVLVFEHLGEADGGHEVWGGEGGLPDWEGAVQLFAPGDLPAGGANAFERLPRSELALGEAWSRLERSGGYRPLLLTGWRQPGFGPGNARAVLIDGETMGGVPVQGTVRFHRQRFLHVEAELLLARDGTDARPGRYRIRERRRMRSREVHYLDHPVFGVLLLAIPWGATPAPEEPPDDALEEPES
jgi:hypothetical protein